MKSTRDFLKASALLVVASLAWNYVLPGVVAYFDGTFYEAGIEAKLPEHDSAAISAYRNYKLDEERLRQLLLQTDQQIANLVARGQGSSDLHGLLEVRNAYRSELASLRIPIHLLPCYGNLTNYYFSMTCVFLGLLLFWGLSIDKARVRLRNVAVSGLGLYVGWASIGWLRNFVFFREGRTIFSFANYDISRIGFLLQELRALVMFVLVAIVWELYFEKADAASSEFSRTGCDSLAALADGAATVSRLFGEWQIASLLLFCSFLPWTFFYYSNVIRSGDSRYILSALVMHIYWLVSWILLTLPLAISFRKWSNLRLGALALRSEETGESKGTDRGIAFLKELNPLSSAQILWASIASVVSLFLPLLDVFKKL